MMALSLISHYHFRINLEITMTPTSSQRIVHRFFVAAGLALLFAPSAMLRAAPLPPELNLVPREAAAFVSIRVADMWNDARLKPLREFFEKDPELVGHFERKFGFKLAELERFSVIVPGFDRRRGPSEPCLVLTLQKPYDLERVLDSFEALAPGEWRQAQEESIRPAKTPVFPKDFKNDQPKPESFPKREFKEKTLLKEQFISAQRGDDIPAAKAKGHKRDLKATYYVFRDGFLVPIDNRTIAVCINGPFRGGLEVNELLVALLRRSDDGPLASALEAAAGKSVLVAGCNLRSIKEAFPKGGMIEILPIHSILASRSAVLTVDLADELKLSLRIDAEDEATAKRVLEVLKALHVLGGEMIPGMKKLAESQEEAALMKTFIALFEPIFNSAEFERNGNSVTATMKTKLEFAAWTAMLMEGVENVRKAAEKVKAQNNLKQVVLSVHNYESAYGRFPFPGVSAPQGQPQGAVASPQPNLSWRVGILPFIEQQNLYTQFHFDEPWDSDHNKKLIPLMPRIYAPYGKADAPKGHTHLRVFNSPGTFGLARSFADITDGTSNTIMVVESSELVPWTKPDDFPLDPKKPKAKLGLRNGIMNVALGDGSVRIIDLSKISDETLRNAITIADGFVLGSDW
jgi:hypothetical protein